MGSKMNVMLVFLVLFGAIYCGSGNPAKDIRHPYDVEESNVVDPEEGNPSEGSIDEPKKILESLDAEMPSRESSGKNSKRFVFSFGRAHQMAHQNAHRKHRLFHPSHFQYFMKNFKRMDQERHDKYHTKDASKWVVPKADSS